MQCPHSVECRTLQQHVSNGRDHPGTSSLHGCRISTDCPLGELMWGWVWLGAFDSFTHACTLITVAGPRVQAVYRPSVWHTPPVWNQDQSTTSLFLSHKDSLPKLPLFLMGTCFRSIISLASPCNCTRSPRRCRSPPLPVSAPTV
jgi:hypothetical protein